MINLKEKINGLLIVLPLLLVGCSCSFLGKISYDTCSTFSYERKITTSNFDEKLGPSKSILVRIPKATDTIKKDLACILKSEYKALSKSERKGLVLLTLHDQEDAIVITYGMYFSRDVLTEMQFTPQDEENYIITFSALFPLKNVIKTLSNPKAEVIVVPLSQKYGLMTKIQVLELLSQVTNGLFLKPSK